VAREKKEVVLTTNLTDPSPFPSPHSQAAEDDRTGSLKKERIAKSNHEKWCFSTLPRKVGGEKENGEAATTRTKTPQPDSVEPGAKIPKSRSTSDNISLGLLESHLVLPPPPSFKSVHFAPGVEDEPGCPPIPTEGLPRGPARDPKAGEERLGAGEAGSRLGAGDATGGQAPDTAHPHQSPEPRHQTPGPAKHQAPGGPARRDPGRQVRKGEFLIPKSEVIPIKLRSRDKVINPR